MTVHHKFKAVLFDADGTLLDTREFIYQAFEYTFRHHGIPPVPREKLSPLMGTPLEKVYATIVPDTDAAVLSATHREFQRHNGQLVQVYPGVIETLKTLKAKGIKTAIITSRKEHVASTLEHTEIFDLVDVVVTGQDVARHKPHPEGVLKVAETLNLLADVAVMVGDTPSDIEAGKNAGMTTVGVTWGFYGPAIQQTHPDYVISDMEELLPIVLST